MPSDVRGWVSRDESGEDDIRRDHQIKDGHQRSGRVSVLPLIRHDSLKGADVQFDEAWGSSNEDVERPSEYVASIDIDSQRQ